MDFADRKGLHTLSQGIQGAGRNIGKTNVTLEELEISQEVLQNYMKVLELRIQMLKKKRGW